MPRPHRPNTVLEQLEPIPARTMRARFGGRFANETNANVDDSREARALERTGGSELENGTAEADLEARSARDEGARLSTMPGHPGPGRIKKLEDRLALVRASLLKAGAPVGLAQNKAGVAFRCGTCEYFSKGHCGNTNPKLNGRAVDGLTMCCNLYDHNGMQHIVD